MHLFHLAPTAQINYVYERLYLFHKTITDPTALAIALKWLAFDCISINPNAKYWTQQIKKMLYSDNHFWFDNLQIFFEFADHLVSQQNQRSNHEIKVNQWNQAIKSLTKKQH